MALLEVKNVQFSYGKGARAKTVLRGVSAAFEPGQL